ncbi:LysR family transcriptional regulator [Vibrio sp. 10N.261.55.A7]|uniref:LysR family transcriptional regulator n=1 Tax=Vibrio sp. 10N.261.55.A7 TaxID=1880851 RepID=UPI000C826E91|nr:LysR family transcriptional regulator [Vibrio sp. 10N.261.55.A7]PMK03235.1 transcriptional regulator [Vibrio sp. 10N.261.55.A7]
MDKLNLLQLFVSLVENGSFVGVANQSGQSPSTVSKAIARLEKDLGVRLLHRTTRQLQLTEAGSHYLQTARDVLSLIDSSERELAQSSLSPSGTLKVSLPLSFGKLYVVPLIPDFCDKYPDINIELSFSDEYTNIVDSGTDIAIRSGRLDDSNLIARQLCPIDMGIFASPSYLEQFGTPISAEQLASHRWIVYRFRQSGRLLEICSSKDEEIFSVDPDYQIIVDNGDAMARLACQGAGLAFMPHFIARDLVQNGELTLISPPQRKSEQAVYLYYLSRDYMPAKVRVFIEYIVEQLEKQGETAYKTWMSNGAE